MVAGLTTGLPSSESLWPVTQTEDGTSVDWPTGQSLRMRLWTRCVFFFSDFSVITKKVTLWGVWRLCALYSAVFYCWTFVIRTRIRKVRGTNSQIREKVSVLKIAFALEILLYKHNFNFLLFLRKSTRMSQIRRSLVSWRSTQLLSLTYWRSSQKQARQELPLATSSW